MFYFLKIFFIVLAVIFTSAFLIFLAAINFWLVFFFLAVIFFIISYFLGKIAGLKKEKTGSDHLLQASEKKFSNSEMEKNRISKIFVNFSEGILAIDENEKVFLANPTAKKILGIKSEEIIGMKAKDFCQISGAEFLTPYFSSLNMVLKQKVNFKNFVIELSATTLIFEEKNMGKMIILRDITSENLFEKMKTDFVLSVVHQLKTSATSAKWSLKMFLTGDFGKISKEQKNVIERLYKRNNILIFSTDNLLSTTKIEDGAYFYQKTLVDIQDIVQSVTAYFQDEIKSKKIKFLFKKPPYRLQKLKLDKEKIESVIENIFDNALKYTPGGGNIEVSLDSDGKDIKFQIKDSGIGIPDSQQTKIFGKFFRAGNANKLEANGSGIGLFLAKKIIEGHGGAIWFESKENKGSAFYFTLPVE